MLLFDLGGVLVENSGFQRLSQLLKTSRDPDSIKDRWLTSIAVRRFELGQFSPNEFANAFTSEWDISLSPEDFLAEFATWPRGFYSGAPEILRLLRTEHRVGCLSNSNALHWERFGGFKRDFDFTFSSHLMGCIKPEKQAFHHVLKACAAEPEETYFFDDSLPNVRSAEEIGLKAFHVEGFNEVMRILRHEGLLRAQNLG